MKKLLLLFLPVLHLHGSEPLLTFENRPMGSPEAPLVLRTYLPSPQLGPEVFSQHDTGRKVSKYNPTQGEDVKGEVKPISGITAGIGVNFGLGLSYVFDTTECRLLYAWQGGFVDMTPYWGDKKRGSRVSMDYVPRLIGTLFWKAGGKDPLEFNGRSVSDLGERVYTGYKLDDQGAPVFAFKAGEVPFTLAIGPSETPLSCEITVSTSTPGRLSWRGVPEASGQSRIRFTLAGSEIETHQGYQVDTRITEASVEAGARLFNQYGCSACHSIDGSKSHGPSVGLLFGRKVELEGGGEPVVANRDYIIESIKAPNAKIVKGYPPNYMPPFALQDLEYESLYQYIRSLSQPE